MDGVMSCFPKTMQHPTATCHGAGKADDDARRRNAGDAATARPGPWWPGRQAVEGEDGRTVGTVRKPDGQPQALKRPRTAAHTQKTSGARPGSACDEVVQQEAVRRGRSEERRVGKEGRSRWSPDH